jgi:hypothetical protein
VNVSVGATMTVIPAKIEGTVSASNRIRIQSGARSTASATHSSANGLRVRGASSSPTARSRTLDNANFVNGLVTQSYSGEVNQIIVEKGSVLNVSTTLTMTGAANPILVHSGGRIVAPQTNGLVLAVTCSGATTTGIMLSNGGHINYNGGGAASPRRSPAARTPSLIDSVSYTVADLSCTAQRKRQHDLRATHRVGSRHHRETATTGGAPIALKIGPFVTGQQPTCSITHRGTFWVMPLRRRSEGHRAGLREGRRRCVRVALASTDRSPSWLKSERART